MANTTRSDNDRIFKPEWLDKMAGIQGVHPDQIIIDDLYTDESTDHTGIVRRINLDLHDRKYPRKYEVTWHDTHLTNWYPARHGEKISVGDTVKQNAKGKIFKVKHPTPETHILPPNLDQMAENIMKPRTFVERLEASMNRWMDNQIAPMGHDIDAHGNHIIVTGTPRSPIHDAYQYAYNTGLWRGASDSIDMRTPRAMYEDECRRQGIEPIPAILKFHFNLFQSEYRSDTPSHYTISHWNQIWETMQYCCGCMYFYNAWSSVGHLPNQDEIVCHYSHNGHHCRFHQPFFPHIREFEGMDPDPILIDDKIML